MIGSAWAGVSAVAEVLCGDGAVQAAVVSSKAKASAGAIVSSLFLFMFCSLKVGGDRSAVPVFGFRLWFRALMNRL
jgi:hypothetical protein